jgi:hypothetical protein
MQYYIWKTRRKMTKRRREKLKHNLMFAQKKNIVHKKMEENEGEIRI